MGDPTPRDRQIADFLAMERLSAAVDECFRVGHHYNDPEEPDRCVRCGRVMQEDYDIEDQDLPF